MGSYSNLVKTEWLEDDPKKMRLLESIIYTDNNGKRWIAPSGSIIDGASIPRFFWRLIGGPFSGKYRRASVIHDVYCVTKSEGCKATHRMFLEAMLSDKVTNIKAKIMYRAVLIGGPKW